MLASEFGLKKAVILGATGMMGQMFAKLLAHHEWFQLSGVAASDRNVGKSYGDSVTSRGAVDLPEAVRDLVVVEPETNALEDADLVFSALPADVAGPVEEKFAREGYPVFTNASSHRLDDDVPLMNPEVNPNHSVLIEEQRRRRKWDGFIVANPNCTTSILTLSLKPLVGNFGLDTVIVASMQALSGAGYPGVASLDILGNVIPFIRFEEEKVERETCKILGDPAKPAELHASASCHRVPTLHGHMEAVFVKTRSPCSPEEASAMMSRFSSLPQSLKLPSAPHHPIVVRREEDRPQTRFDVDEGNGMAVSVGRVRDDPALGGLKYIALGHNLVRGGAGCSILNAELLVCQKRLP